MALSGRCSLVAACGKPDKGEIIRKAEGAATKAELEQALGTPDEVDKLGPVEKWTYRASDGEVVFVIAAGQITLEATTSKQ